MQILEQALILSILSLGVYITFKIIDTPDLTVDGSYVLGGSVAVSLMYIGIPWGLSIFIGSFAGGLSGILTGIIHAKTKINPLLASILVMTMLYSINIRIMDGPNLPIPKIQKESSVSLSGTKLDEMFEMNNTTISLGKENKSFTKNFLETNTFIKLLIFSMSSYFLLFLFLKTELGLSLRAFGSNKYGIISFGIKPEFLSILGLFLGNFFAGLSGSLFSMYAGFSDVNMGQGMLVTGLATVILGEIILGKKEYFYKLPAPFFGAIIYSIIITMVIKYGYKIGFKSSDLKLTTVLFIIGVILSRRLEVTKWLNLKKLQLSTTTIR
ncbi:hypothetical protein XO12_07550 [Marinitoga sp. 1154]|nr:hypothetical protein [Marinitoga sp. 1154]